MLVDTPKVKWILVSVPLLIRRVMGDIDLCNVV